MEECPICGRQMQPGRVTCSQRCRQRKYRQEQKRSKESDPVATVTTAKELRGLTIEDAVRAELTELGRLNSALGQQALELARRMSTEDEFGAGVASLSRELRAVMVEVAANAAPAENDPLDELRARRDRKRRNVTSTG